MKKVIEYIIYKLTFPNGKIYIGQTDDFDKRMYQYQWFATAEKAKKYPVYNYLISKKIRKYGWNNIKKEILFTVSEEFVDELETKLIAEHKSANYNFGYNVLTDAKSPRGYKHSEESKEKQRKSMKGREGYWKNKKRPNFSGKNHPMFGVDRTGKNAPNYGKKLSEEAKEKIRQIKSKPINMYDKITNKFIKTFESSKQAGKKLNIFRQNINANLRGKQKSAGGFIFKYANGE